MTPRIIALSMAALLSACSADKTAPAAAAPKPAFGNFGIDTAQMDTSVKPGDDFYKLRQRQMGLDVQDAGR